MQILLDVRPLTSDDYEKVIERYLSKCANIRGVSAIYQFGSVAAPGLSDIDLMVVLGDGVRRNEDLQPLSIAHPFWGQEPLIRDCFIHDVFVCPEAVFRDIDWIIPGNEWRHLAGAVIERRTPTDEEREVVSLVHGLDFAIGRLHELARIAHGIKCSSRWLIPQLWSVTHTYRTLANLGAPVSSGWNTLLDTLKQLRRTPPEQLTQADIADLLLPVTEHFASAIDGFADLLTHRGHVSEPRLTRPYRLASHSIRALNVYSAGPQGSARTSADLVERRLTLMGRTLEAAWSRVELPGAVLSHHLAYLSVGSRDPAAARRIARLAKVAHIGLVRGVYGSVLKTRRELVDRNSQALAAREITFTRMAIPGLLTHASSSMPTNATWRQRLLMSWLDWRALPARTMPVGRT